MKKSRKKRISAMISLVLAFTMLLGTGSVFAENGEEPNEENNSEIIYEAESFLSAYFSEPTNIYKESAVYKLGESIPTYQYYNNELVKFSKAMYYPVYENNKVLGILTINGADEKYPTYSFGKEFSMELNHCLDNNINEYCFIICEGKIYLKSSTQLNLLADYSTVNLNSTKYLSKESNELEEIRNFHDDTLISYSRHNIISYLTIFSKKENTQKNSGFFTPKSKVLPVITWKQGNNGLCWAATLSCIGFFIVKDYFITPEDIAKGMGIGVNEGGYTWQSNEAFKKFYNLNGTQISSLSDSRIMDNIDGQRPIYMNFQSPNYGHAVALRGYFSDPNTNEFKISVMDPVVGDYVWYKKTGGTYKYTRGETYVFDEALLI